MILRGGKALPLYARVVEAGVPRAIVLPAQAGGQLQVGKWVNAIDLCGAEVTCRHAARFGTGLTIHSLPASIQRTGSMPRSAPPPGRAACR